MIELLNDNAMFNFHPQLIISAYDSTMVNDRGTLNLIIDIERNLNSPVWENGQNQYTASIKDYDPKGTFVVNVNATDADLTVTLTFCYFL